MRWKALEVTALSTQLQKVSTGPENSPRPALQLARNFTKFSVLSGLHGAVGCGYRWKHCAKPV